MRIKVVRNSYDPSPIGIVKGLIADYKNYGIFPILRCFADNQLPIAGGNRIMNDDGCYYADPINDQIVVIDYYAE